MQYDAHFYRQNTIFVQQVNVYLFLSLPEFMKKSKLFTLLNHFTAQERRATLLHFKRPYYTQKHPEMYALLQYLLENTDNAELLERHNVFTHIFSAKIPYNDLKLRRTASVLLQQVETFWVMRQLHTDELELSIRLMELYRKGRLIKNYKDVQKQALQQLQREAQRSAAYFLSEYRIYRNTDNFTDNRNDPEKQQYVCLADAALDHFYLLGKLKLACELYSLQTLVKTKFTIANLQTVVNIATEPAYMQQPVIALYYHALQTLLLPNEAQTHFEQVKQRFVAHSNLLTHTEAAQVYYLALNYCATQINKGEERFWTEIFDLYQIGLEQTLLLENGELSPWNYKNIVTVALRLGKNDFAHQFIHQYHLHLPVAHRLNALAFNLAKYFFTCQQYTQALHKLQEVSYDEIFYSLDARLLLLKTYYALDEFDALEALIDSFRQFLNRTRQINRQRQTTYRNLLRFLRRFNRIAPSNRKQLSELLAKIEQTPYVAERNWLLDIVRSNA